MFDQIGAEKTPIKDKGTQVAVVEGMIVRAGKKDWCQISVADG